MTQPPVPQQCHLLRPPPFRSPYTQALPNPAGNLGFQIQKGSRGGRAYALESMTWDGADGYILLFRGSTRRERTRGDTWTYLHRYRTQLTPPITHRSDSTRLVYEHINEIMSFSSAGTLRFGRFSERRLDLSVGVLAL